MPIRPSLAVPWREFVSHWCLDWEPGFTEAELGVALETLERLLPEHLDHFETSGVRGLWPSMNTVHLGLLLSRTEKLSGFHGVFARMQAGDVSALTELECADALVRVEVVPALAVPLNGKLLDAAFVYAGRMHYVEVVAPNRSDAIREAETMLSQFGASLAGGIRGMTVEVLFEPEIGEEQAGALLAAIFEAPVSPQIHELPGVGRFRKDAALNAQVASAIPHVGESPLLAIASTAFDGQAYATYTLRLPVDDQRAQRTLDAELHHFSRDEANLLFIDVTRVVGGLASWMPLIERRFQPTINTRIGAAVLFDRATVVGQNRSWERWKVLRNPHARVPVANELVDVFRALDFGPIPVA